jgi:hypothetical protein
MGHQLVEQLERLEHEADLMPSKQGEAALEELVYPPSVHLEVTRRRPVTPAEQLQQR